MPKTSTGGEKPKNSPNAGRKKPAAPVKTKSAERETRLAEALRENLRRRKAKASIAESKEE